MCKILTRQLKTVHVTAETLLLNFLVLVLLLITTPLHAEDFDDSQIMHIDYPEWFITNEFFELNEDLDHAISNNKKGLMVLFTTEGCSYCDMFIKTSLGNQKIAGSVQRNFDVIGLEIFDDTEMTHPNGESTTIKDFATSEDVEFSPTVLFFGEGGKRFLKLVGYQNPERFQNILSFIENRKSGENFRTYLKRKKLSNIKKVTYQLNDDILFEVPPYMLDRSKLSAQKPLMVIFESNGCAECQNFHSNVLADSEIRDELTKLEIVRLDSVDNKVPVIAPDGKRTTPYEWYESKNFTNLPALIFYDENGKEILKTEALVLKQRMMNSLGFVLDKAYLKDWTYQRYARTKSIEKLMEKQNSNQ